MGKVSKSTQSVALYSHLRNTAKGITDAGSSKQPDCGHILPSLLRV